MKIAALSSCCVDIYPEMNQVYVGGNSLNFATQCKLRGGEDVSVIGALGNDTYARLIERHLDSLAINRKNLYRIDAPTASNKIFIDKNGNRYFKEDSWNGGAFDIFRLSELDWQQLLMYDIIAMPAGDPNLEELLNRRNKNQLVLVDFLDYFSLEFVERHIDRIDISFMSCSEDKLVNVQALARRKDKMIVTTLGAQGSVAYYQGLSYVQPAIEVDEIIDTTGCGDAFQAAFVIEWVASRDIRRSLQVASLAASRVLGFVGGVE